MSQPYQSGTTFSTRREEPKYIDKSVSHLESEKALISIELVSLDKEQTYHNLVSDMKDLLLRHNQGHQHKVMPALEYKIAIV